MSNDEGGGEARLQRQKRLRGLLAMSMEVCPLVGALQRLRWASCMISRRRRPGGSGGGGGGKRQRVPDGWSYRSAAVSRGPPFRLCADLVRLVGAKLIRVSISVATRCSSSRLYISQLAAELQLARAALGDGSEF